MDRVARAAAVRMPATASGFYQITGAGTSIGSASMTGIGVIYRNPRPRVSAQQELFGNFAGGSGWGILLTGGSTLEAIVLDGAGANVVSATYVYPLFGPAGAIVIGFSYDGTNLRVNIGGFTTGTTVAGTPGYTVSATPGFGIGARPNTGSSNVRNYDPAAYLHTDATALSAAALATAVAQVQENLQQGRALSALLSFAPQHYWDAVDVAVGSAVVPRTNWPDRVGALALTKAGTPSAIDYPGQVTV